MSATSPSFENWTFSEEMISFAARIIYPDDEDKRATVYIVHAEQNDDVASTTTVGPDNDLRAILHDDSSETAGDLDDLTAIGGSDQRYMPTGVY